jgi:hypothetical protein
MIEDVEQGSHGIPLIPVFCLARSATGPSDQEEPPCLVYVPKTVQQKTVAGKIFHRQNIRKEKDKAKSSERYIFL